MAGLLGEDWDDPKTQMNLMLAAGLLGGRGNFAQVLGGALPGAMQARNQAGAAQQAKQLQAMQMQRMLAQIEEDKAQAEQRRATMAAAQAEAARKAQFEEQLKRSILPPGLENLPPNVQGPPAELPHRLDENKFITTMAQFQPEKVIDLIRSRKEPKGMPFEYEIGPDGQPRMKPGVQAAKESIAKAGAMTAPVPLIPAIGPSGKPELVTPPNRAGGRPQPTGYVPVPSRDSNDRVSPTLQKKLIEIAESADAGAIAISQLDEALKYSPKAYTGYGATMRATARSNIPGKDDEAASATIQYDNIIRTQALESLKAMFGAMPTEGERKVLLELQASADKTHGQRKEIIERAQRLARERIDRDMKLADDIRSGKYSTLQGVSATNQPRPATGSPSPVNDPLGIRR